MSYVDVEISAEALLEDEELIEAVNEIVEAAAAAVYTDIKNDVSGILLRIRYFLETAFPFLIDWREDPAAFPQAMKSLALSFLLYLIAFWILAPSRRWRMDHRQKKRFQTLLTSDKRTSSLKLLRRKLAATFNKTLTRQMPKRRYPLERSRSTSSIALLRLNPFRRESEDEDDDDDEEEETEEEKFTQRWPAILQTKYGCLVLPPECMRVEKPKNARESDQKRASAASVPSVPEETMAESDDENPYKRLVNYCRNILHLIMSLLRFDYVGAGYSLFHWIDWWLRNRRNRQVGVPPIDIAEDEASEAGNSGVVRRLSFGSNGSSSKNEGFLPQTTTPVSSPKGKTRSKRDTLVKLLLVDDKVDAGETTDTVDGLPKVSLLDMSIEGEEKKEAMGLDSDDIGVSYSENLHNPPSTPTSSQRFKNPSHPGSVYSTPGLDLRDRNVEPGDAMISTLAMSLRSNQQQHLNGIPKPKDALESYRKPVLKTKSVHVSTSDSPATVTAIPVGSPVLPPRFESTRQNSTGSTGEVTTVELASHMNHIDQGHFRTSDSNSAYYFEPASTQAMLKRMSVEVPVPDRNGYIIGDEFLPNEQEWKPLLVFVNSRSGPQQGQFLIAQLRGLLNPIQVWDLATGGPEEILESFTASFSRLRILVCGGDGTVSWIVSTIDNMKIQRKPPIAILPLGTGNDLARIHGWGGGYNNEPLTAILEQVADSYISWLDRWEMTIENKRGHVKEVKSFFNYLGVGADAQAALQVHLLRESRPQLFFSRVVNKAWYGVFGAEDILKATSVNLPYEITLIADGVEVPLPDDSQGIILLNIDSYAGGVPLWSLGSKDDSSVNSPITSRSNSWNGSRLKRSHSFDTIKEMKEARQGQAGKEAAPNVAFERVDSVDDLNALSGDEKFRRVTACDRPSSCQDGLLDVVSIRGAFHLGQIRVGLSNAQKICQSREVTIHIKRKVSIQIDGEPWRQEVCTLRVKRKKDAAIMLHRSAVDSNGVETEMANLLDWAEDKKLIDEKIHAALMKEFSRRIESKTRQRREQNNRQVGFSLKRAIASSGNMGGGNGSSAGIMF